MHSACRNKLLRVPHNTSFYLKLFCTFQPAPHFNNGYVIITITHLLAWHFIFLPLLYPTVEGKENSLLISCLRPTTITVLERRLLGGDYIRARAPQTQTRTANYKSKYFIASNQIG